MLREQFKDYFEYFCSPEAIPMACQILTLLLVGKLVLTIERGEACFTGEIKLHRV